MQAGFSPYHNPPAPPGEEVKKPTVLSIKKGFILNGVDLHALINSEALNRGIALGLDIKEDFSYYFTSSEEEGEIKDDEPPEVINEVRIKKEPVENETNQRKDGIGERSTHLDIRQEDSNKTDSNKSRKHSKKHRKKAKDDSESDESDYSDRCSKTQKAPKSPKNDPRNDDSDDSVEFLEDIPKEKKIVTVNCDLSSSDSDHSSDPPYASKEKKEHGTPKKQKEHFRDEDRYSKKDTYSCPLPPARREDPKDGSRVKKDKDVKEYSKTRRLEELFEKKVMNSKEKKKKEERNVEEERSRKEEKEERNVEEERSRKEEKEERREKREKSYERSVKAEKSIKEEKGFFKEEPGSSEPVQHIYGSYSCETCHITMNCVEAYNKHMVGKRHLKKLKLLNPHLVVASTITPSATEGNDKYPRPLPGVTRKKMKEEATIQRQLESVKNSKTPFPGLENVIEIHLLTERKYYCKLCDSPCAPESIVPHLRGYKHRLKLLKFFRPGLAEKYAYKEKHVIDDKICQILYDIQRKEGIGKMSVEKDFPADSTSYSHYYDSRPSTSREIRDMPSTSRQPDFEERYARASRPNPDKPGFYCDVCLVNTNSEKGWEDHIRGKRHIKNLKKAPGELPSKCTSVPAPNLHPRLLDYIEEQLLNGEPVVGLKYVQETQNHELNMETYHCFLCGAFMTSLDIIDHLISFKHRMKYLDEIKHPTREILDTLRGEQAENVMEELCNSHLAEQRMHGRREMPTVHLAKSSGLLLR